ncbi:hypothetical protein [Paraburkholderia tropica]|uniref:hypothetical protein n=1 Tax=Paraburkholderia tropica TaxID=92647 RepID=UPI002AB7D160|nr:hypothetical protein [Paraburkholderia tropica]
MNYGIELLQVDMALLILVKGYASKNMTGHGQIAYYELGTNDQLEWEGWRKTLDAAKRPYKYIVGVNGKAVPLNGPQW